MTVRASARDRLEAALARIADPAGEGARVFIAHDAARARLMADAADARAAAGLGLGPLDGRLVSIKDCCDVVGEPTRAGSATMNGAAAATADAPAVARLRRAGAVLVGRTNMSEFAFTGLGVNPHFGTPGNPADRARCPGGSSSGAAVSVADGMAEIGLGTDTGGSVRIPAAFCGVVGFKPTKTRVPTDGVFPLSFLLDSVGPIARTVQDCADADAVLSGAEASPLAPPDLGAVRFAVARGPVMADLDAAVAAAFAAALDTLGRAGARLPTLDLSPIDQMARAGALGGVVPPESAFIHRGRLETHGAGYDPVVRARIAIGERMSAVDAVATQRLQIEGIAAMDAHLSDVDAVLMPTAPIPAPRIDAVTPSVETFLGFNAKALRNTYLANFHGLCAISLPIPVAGLPVGLSLVGRAHTDRRLLAIAAAVERAFAR